MDQVTITVSTPSGRRAIFDGPLTPTMASVEAWTNSLLRNTPDDVPIRMVLTMRKDDA